MVEDEEGEGGGVRVIVMGSAHLRPKTTVVSCGDCSHVRPTDLRPDTAGEVTTMSAMSAIQQLLALVQVGKDKRSTQGSQGHEEQLPGEAGGHCGGGDGKRANVGALKGMGGRGVVEVRGDVEVRGYTRTSSQGSKDMRESNRASSRSSWDGCGCEDDDFTALTHDHVTTHAQHALPSTHTNTPPPPTHTQHTYIQLRVNRRRGSGRDRLSRLFQQPPPHFPLSLSRSLALSASHSRTHTHTHTNIEQ